jgi:hypothetical protein
MSWIQDLQQVFNESSEELGKKLSSFLYHNAGLPTLPEDTRLEFMRLLEEYRLQAGKVPISHEDQMRKFESLEITLRQEYEDGTLHNATAIELQALITAFFGLVAP